MPIYIGIRYPTKRGKTLNLANCNVQSVQNWTRKYSIKKPFCQAWQGRVQLAHMRKNVTFSILVSGIIFTLFCLTLFFWPKNAHHVTFFSPHRDTEISGPFQYAGPWDEPLYTSLYARIGERPANLPSIKGGIVPHHLLAGHLDARFFETIAAQKPSTIVIISPNHFSRGTAPVISTNRHWQTVFGSVKTNQKLLQVLEQKGIVSFDEEAIKEEHGVYGLIPFVAKSLPDTTVIPLILRHDASTSTLDTLVKALTEILPKNAVIVGSVDFSHYQTAPVANFHDELSRNVIQTFDYARIPLLEIDSQSTVYTVLKLMDVYGTKHIAYEAHENAADVVGNQAETNITSYYTPYFSTGEAATGTAVSVLSFGDIMLDRQVKEQIDAHGQNYLLQALAGQEGRFFHGMDIISANMEGPFANSRRETSKEIAFRFDLALLPMLKRYNFSTFSQANNHSYDMGKEAEQESKDNMRNAGFFVYGSQYRVDDDSLLIRDISGKRVAFIGINDTNTPIDERETLRLIQKAEQEADITILNAHWGIEYEDVSHERQRYLAHTFIDAGVDAIIGHHPHWVQEMEIYKDRPIFYSLGNFIFDQYFSVNTQRGLGVGLVFHSDHISGYLFPLQSMQSQVSLMPYTTATSVTSAFVDRSRIGAYTMTNFHFVIPIESYGISNATP